MRDLVANARADAERAAPAVKAAALLHIARVLTTIDAADSVRTLDAALALAATLPEGERDVLLGEGAALAATISPRRALGLVREVVLDRDSVLTRALFNMLAHGHVGDAVAYLSEPTPGEAYPFAAAHQAMGRSSDDEARLRVLRGATRAMRERRRSGAQRHFRRHDYIRLFTHHWARLPTDEARAVVGELVEWILSEPESRTNASFSSGSQRVRFSSTHEQQLFEILGPLRHIDPDRAASVTRDYPQLAAAAERFPYGRESMDAAMHAELPPTPREPVEQPDYIDVGRRLVPIPDAIRTGFSDAFALALDLYADDSDPENFNEAPQACWASALEFRKILYKAGQHEGVAAARYLDRIPDPALRLFAQIELAAAVAGLPPIGGRSIRPGPRGLRDMVAAHRGSESQPSAIPPSMRPLPPPRRPTAAPSRELRISPATRPADEGPSGGAGPDFVEIRNASLRGLVAQLFNMPDTRIEWPSSLDPSARYDFLLVLPAAEEREAQRRLMQDGIARHFHISLTTELRPRDVHVLTAPNGITARAVREKASFEFGSIGIGAGSVGSIDIGARPAPSSKDSHPRIPEAVRLQEILDAPTMDERLPPADAFAEMRRHITRQFVSLLGPHDWIGGLDASLTIQELCETIEAGLDRPLIDETNLTGTYAIRIPPSAATTVDFLRLVCDSLGLVATLARREVRTLVIRVV
jgi:uncharacterized protein (TIGR03435 family)